LQRYEEARDAILSQGHFSSIELRMAVDACFAMGDHQEEMRLLWVNKKDLKNEDLYYALRLMQLRGKLMGIEAALEYHQDVRRPEYPLYEGQKVLLELFLSKGASKRGVEFASTVWHHHHEWEKKGSRLSPEQVKLMTLAERVVALSDTKIQPMLSPAEVKMPPNGYCLEIHPIEWVGQDEELASIAQRISDLWGLEVAVYPNMKLPKIHLHIHPLTGW